METSAADHTLGKGKVRQLLIYCLMSHFGISGVGCCISIARLSLTHAQPGHVQRGETVWLHTADLHV